MNSDVETQAKNLYNEIRRFYQCIVDVADPEDYEIMKQELGFQGTYEEHTSDLLAKLKPKEETIKHIEEFLQTYKLFQHSRFVTVIQMINQKMDRNRQQTKEAAYKFMVQYEQEQQELDELEEVLEEGETPEDFDIEYSTVRKVDEVIDEMENDNIELSFGGQPLTLATYKDPLLTNLYRMLVMWATLEMYGVQSQSIGHSGCL